MHTARRRDQLLPLVGSLMAGCLLALVALEPSNGVSPWSATRVAGDESAVLFAPYLLMAVAGVSLAGAGLALLGEGLSGLDRLLGTTLAAGLALIVAPEVALAIAATASLAGLHRRSLLGTRLGPLGSLAETAAALGTGVLVTRAFADGTGILASQLARPAQTLHLVAPGWELGASLALLLTWSVAAGALAAGPVLRRTGAVLAVLSVVAAGPLLLHDAPWTFRWSGHVNAMQHIAYLAVLIGGLRALTGSGGLRAAARAEHLSCCGLLLVAGLLADPGRTLLGGLLAVLLFVATLDRRRARERDDLRWRKPRQVQPPAAGSLPQASAPGQLQA